MIYDNLVKNMNNVTQIKNKVIIHFVNGPYAEIKGSVEEEYVVKFINKATNNTVYETTIKNGMWARCNIKYFVDWKIEIWRGAELYHEHNYSSNDKRVFIAIDSKSLGDTLAWIPYVEEYRKKHNSNVICSTFWNNLFKDQYPHISFVDPGTTVHNLYSMYVIGLFYKENGEFDFNANLTNPITVPLQQVASDILGIPYQEIRPRFGDINVSQDDKLITIGIHSTTQAKYWNNPSGWQEVVDWLISRGYTVKLMSQEPDGYMGNKNPTGVVTHPPGPIDSVITEIKKSRLFIGLGSGLSWLSWAVGTPTAIISGFSYKWAEMQDCIRIGAPSGKCEGCFNRYKLNAGDWNWCPDHKDTPRQFECSRNITAEMVIRELEKVLQ
jgi:autotransporter strand-loop-strand O-heptosyltransferase